MSQIKFIKTTSENLDSVQVSDGQVLAVTDTGDFYIDFDGTRTEYGGKSSVKMYFDTDANILATDSTDTEALYYATDTGRIYRRIYVQDAPDGSGPYYIWLNINGVNALTVEEGTKYGKKWDITGLVKIAKAFQTGAGMWFSGGAVLGEAALLNVYDPNLGEPTSDSSFRSFYPTTIIDTMVGECVKNADIYTTSKIHIGSEASATGGGSVAIGREANASGSQSIAIGAFAESPAKRAIQLGEGVNSTEKSLAVGYGETDDEDNPISYPLLVGNLIPEERIPDTIARVSDVPNSSNCITKDMIHIDTQENILALEGTDAADYDKLYYANDTGVLYKYLDLCKRNNGTWYTKFVPLNKMSTVIHYIAKNYGANPDQFTVTGLVQAAKAVQKCSGIYLGTDNEIAFVGENQSDTYVVPLSSKVNELISDVNTTVNDNKSEVERMSEDVASMSEEFDAVKSQFTELEGTYNNRMNGFNDRLSKLENDGRLVNVIDGKLEITLERNVRYDVRDDFVNDLVLHLEDLTDYLESATLHFSTGDTPTFTYTIDDPDNGLLADFKMIGYHCYAGKFTPVKNTRYTIVFDHDFKNVVGYVGGYAID